MIKTLKRRIPTFLVALTSLQLLSAEVNAGPIDSFTSWLAGKRQHFDESSLRILIAHKVPEAVVEVKGRFGVYDPVSQRRLSGGFMERSFVAMPQHDGLVWGEGFPGVYQISLEPEDKDGFFWVNGLQYKGRLLIYQIGERLSLVNEADIEDYVFSALSGELNETDYDEEVASAIAICIRSRALAGVHDRPKAYWHIYAKDNNYMGFGASSQEALARIVTNKTRGMVLVNHGQEQHYFSPTWTQHSGGTTLSAGRVLDVPIAAQDRGNTAWTLNFDESDLSQMLLGETLSDNYKLELVHEKGSNKVKAVKIGDHQIAFEEMQEKLGLERLPSNDFSVSRNNHEWVFKGYGRGAGHGLCLYTAKKMSQSGKTSPSILSTFFPDAQLKILNESHVR